MRLLTLAFTCVLMSELSGATAWSQFTNLANSRHHFSQELSKSRKPTRKQLAAVEANCSKGDLNRVALHMGLAAYPPKARQKHVSGNVTIKVYINELGDVYYAVPIDGPKLLHNAALSAASFSRFAPFEIDYKPVKCVGLLTYNFIVQ